ncbi:hypothetical protein Q8F55_005507 [Vanrija albida]|uniref:Uncharacterized protein n=1 Tax=Vanrija albida TaxID=181172 RepID=A0ABR3Q1V7_9TREE
MSAARYDAEKGDAVPSDYRHTVVALPPSPPKRANPTPLGLFSFASTTLLLSFLNANTRGLHAANMVVGMAFFVGGLAQFVAGIFEYFAGATFGFTAFVTYGCFWGSIGLIFWPSSGILAAYKTPEDLNNALGLFMMVWFVFTTIMTVGTIRSNVGLFLVFFTVDITFLLLGVGHLMIAPKVLQAGGYVGCVAAFFAFYVATSALYAAEGMPFSLPND